MGTETPRENLGDRQEPADSPQPTEFGATGLNDKF